METLGQKIKDLRLAHKMTLDQVAQVCGVTPQAVSQWETNETANVKLEPFLRLCSYFRVNPYDLVFGDRKDRPPPPVSNTGRFRVL